MAPSAPVRLALIGGFRLAQGGREFRIAVSGQRLIALLALKGRPVGRLHVAGILWPDCSTERSLADLRTALWRVNQSGSTIICATSSLLTLSPDIEVDVERLCSSARGFAVANGQHPVDLDAVHMADFVGELLPDWYDDWLQDERERLRQTCLHALESLARAFCRSGRHDEAIQAALAAIQLEPLRETAHYTLIQIHLAEGNLSEARRQFQRCKQLLAEELGVEPSDSIRRLLEQRQTRWGSPQLSDRTRALSY